MKNYQTIKKWLKLIGIFITNDKTNKFITIQNNILTYMCLECPMLLSSLCFIRKEELYRIFCVFLGGYISYIYSIIMNVSQKEKKSIIDESIPNKKYAEYLYRYHKKNYTI